MLGSIKIDMIKMKLERTKILNQLNTMTFLNTTYDEINWIGDDKRNWT